jgi:hypothetical protein
MLGPGDGRHPRKREPAWHGRDALLTRLEIKIILTGGFAFLFDKKINYPIFADSFLVPKGLNRILKYNEL